MFTFRRIRTAMLVFSTNFIAKISKIENSKIHLAKNKGEFFILGKINMTDKVGLIKIILNLLDFKNI